METIRLFNDEAITKYVRTQFYIYNDMYEWCEDFCKKSEDYRSPYDHIKLYPEELSILVRTALIYIGSLKRITVLLPNHLTLVAEYLKDVYEEVQFYTLLGAEYIPIIKQDLIDVYIGTSLAIVINVLKNCEPYPFYDNSVMNLIGNRYIVLDSKCEPSEIEIDEEALNDMLDHLTIEGIDIIRERVKRYIAHYSYRKILGSCTIEQMPIVKYEFSGDVITKQSQKESTSDEIIEQPIQKTSLDLNKYISCCEHSIEHIQNEIILIASASNDKASFARELKKKIDAKLFIFKYGLADLKKAEALNFILERGGQTSENIFPISRSICQRYLK